MCFGGPLSRYSRQRRARSPLLLRRPNMPQTIGSPLTWSCAARTPAQLQCPDILVFTWRDDLRLGRTIAAPYMDWSLPGILQMRVRVVIAIFLFTFSCHHICADG